MYPANDDASSSYDEKEVERWIRTHQRHRQSGRKPGAVPVEANRKSDRKAERKIVSRGVDLDDVGRPERSGGTMRNDSFVINPAPQSYVSRREARRQAAANESSASMMLNEESDDDNKSMEHPGAIPVPGIFSLSREGVEINMNTRHSAITTTTNTTMISADETQAEAIVAAHLVEDIEKQDRAKIRQEIYNEAEQAEVVDTKRQKRCTILLSCLCVLVLAGIGAGLGFGLGSRQAELNNSICGNSAPLFVGDTIRGSVGNADVSKIETCGPTKPNGDVKGRWFTFLGDGTSVTASTCGNTNFDSQISVYTGSSCQSLDCVAFNDDSPLCSACAGEDATCNIKAAAVTISTTVGVNYYVFVHGTNVNADATFELSLSSGSALNLNDTCEASVNAASFSGDIITGSTEFATFNELPLCGTITENGIGVWYQVRGTGDVMVASTCDSTGTLQNTQISVFQGQCGNLQCAEGSDTACGDSKSSTSWQSIAGTSYYIYVHGGSSQRGTFELRLESTGNQADIDEQCLEATQDFYNNGIQSELEAIMQSMLQTAPTDACQNMQDGSLLCVFDALNNAENNVDTGCQSLGGRYIIKYFTLDCESEDIQAELKLRFTNYPDCVSLLCTDDWIDNGIQALASQIIPLLEGNGISCQLVDSSWADGTVE